MPRFKLMTVVILGEHYDVGVASKYSLGIHAFRVVYPEYCHDCQVIKRRARP